MMKIHSIFVCLEFTITSIIATHIAFRHAPLISLVCGIIIDFNLSCFSIVLQYKSWIQYRFQSSL